MIERKATIFNIQKYNIYDGPGIRTMIFFKGCPLRCKWCSNPEGLERQLQIMVKYNSCINCGACTSVCPQNIHYMSTNNEHLVKRDVECIGCGNCVEVCPKRALSVIGEQKTVSELLEIVEEDVAFYLSSGGGVTLGGGEVAIQGEVAKSLLYECKKAGINTAIETCGYVKMDTLMKMAEFTDLFLYDIKHIDSEAHFKLTGVRNETIIENLKELLHKRYNVKIRMPIIKGLNDSNEDINNAGLFLSQFNELKNFKGVDILPYHKLGVNKYTQLDLEYPLEGEFSLSEEDISRIENIMKKHVENVTVIRH